MATKNIDNVYEQLESLNSRVGKLESKELIESKEENIKPAVKKGPKSKNKETKE